MPTLIRQPVPRRSLGGVPDLSPPYWLLRDRRRVRAARGTAAGGVGAALGLGVGALIGDYGTAEPLWSLPVIVAVVVACVEWLDLRRRTSRATVLEAPAQVAAANAEPRWAAFALYAIVWMALIVLAGLVGNPLPLAAAVLSLALQSAVLDAWLGERERREGRRYLTAVGADDDALRHAAPEQVRHLQSRDA